MKTRSVWILFGLSAILFAGCDLHQDDRFNNMGPNGRVRIKKNIGLDMKSVLGFTLVPQAAQAPQTSPFRKADTGDCLVSTQNNGTPQGACTKLFALSATGSVIPVELVDVVAEHHDGGENGGDNCCMNGGMNNGGQGPTVPDTIYNVGKFVFFVFNGDLQTDAGTCHMIVLQKSDGALYCSVDTVMTCPQNDNCNGIPTDQLVQANADGTIVHAYSMQQSLLQLDFANPASAVSRTLFDSTDGRLAFFLSNGNGDVLTAINPSGTTTMDLRLYKRAGGFANLSAYSTNMGGGVGMCMFPGLGTDAASLYFITPGNGMNGNSNLPAELQNNIVHVGLANGAVTTSTYAHDATGGLSLNYCNMGSTQASTADRHFINFPRNPGSTQAIENEFTEVYNPAGVPFRHTATELKSITRLYGCDKQLVLRGRDPAGNDVISRYYPEAGTSAVVVGSQDYTITAVAVSDSCDVTFGGRRASDNSRILGNIPSDSSEVTVYSNNLPGDIKQLVRIR